MAEFYNGKRLYHFKELPSYEARQSAIVNVVPIVLETIAEALRQGHWELSDLSVRELRDSAVNDIQEADYYFYEDGALA